MKLDIAEKRNLVTRLKEDLARAEANLNNEIRNCSHNWSPAIAAHIYEKAYTIPGDPPSYGGVDHWFDCYVPAREQKRWKRICVNCGEVQYTSNTNKQITETPKFE